MSVECHARIYELPEQNLQLLTKIFCVHIFTENFRVLPSQSLNYLTTTNFIFFGHKTCTVRSTTTNNKKKSKKNLFAYARCCFFFFLKSQKYFAFRRSPL